MRKIIAKIDFIANGKKYIAGDELENLTYQQIEKLNKLGYIEPLTYKDLVLIEREQENQKYNIKEEL